MLNADISKRRDDSIFRGVGMLTQIYVDRAENSEVWDVEGTRYIDFAAGSFRHWRSPKTTKLQPNNAVMPSRWHNRVRRNFYKRGN